MNKGKTLAEIISDAFVGKTILKIDDDESFKNRRIYKAQIWLYYQIHGVKIFVEASVDKPIEELIIPFDQDSTITFKDEN